MNRLIALVVLLVGVEAWAADLHCGRDTDQSGAVDQLCPTPDADFDGNASVADGGTDCDDTDWAMHPGVSGQGADNTKYKTCQTNGSFTTGTDLLTAYTCHSGSGHTFWVDDAETDCTGVGSYADPEDYRCWFDTGMSGYHAPVAGDCIVLQTGSYSAKWGSAPEKMFYVSGISGTSADPIRLRVEPGKVATIEGAGVSPNPIVPIALLTSDYWDINGNDAGLKPGLVVHGNYSEMGVELYTSDYGMVQNVYVYDVDGNCGTNNCGGVKVTNGATNATVKHVQIKDIYNRAAATNPNAASIYASYGDGHNFAYNTLIASSQSVVGEHMFFKHCDASGTATWTFRGNVASKGALCQLDTSCGGATISNNIFLDSKGLAIAFTGVGGNGSSHFEAPSTISYNTVVNGPQLQLFAQGSYEQSSTFGAVSVHHNVFQDNRNTPYYYDSSTGVYRICYYCSDAIYAEIVTGDKISFANNCIYNTTGQALLFTVFGDNGSTSNGADFATFAAWQANSLVYTINEYSEDPELDSYNRATSANCGNSGWNMGAGASPTPTPTATPTPAPPGLAAMRSKRWR